MARAFVRASSQYLECIAPVLTGVPITMACWAWVNNTTQDHVLMSLSDVGTAVNGHHLVASGSVGGDPIQVKSNNAAAESATGYSSGVWFHAMGVWATATARRAYLNGAVGTDNTSSVTPTLDQTVIGRRNNSTNDYLDGKIAEAAIWDVALTTDDALALARGAVPLTVKGAHLKAYWPLIGRYSPENDRMGNNGSFPYPMVVTGATATEHPRVVNMRGLRKRAPYGEESYMMRLEAGNVLVYKITEQPANLVTGIHLYIVSSLGVDTTFSVGNASTELATVTKTAGTSGNFYLAGFSVSDADIYVAAKQS